MKLKTLIILAFCLLLLQTSKAQTTEPILRLNTQMHTSGIGRISIDAKGKYILTASDDKTGKLWSATTGDLLKTFRPSIGYANEGILYAGAISPDGKTVALAGWTNDMVTGYNVIYVFDSTTGELTQRLKGLRNVILDLEFSHDGTYLAAALGGAGVVIYKQNFAKVPTFTKVETLTGCQKASDNIVFDKTGRLATVCYDGKIRLYDKYFNLVKEKKGAGNEPFSVAFSPDGNKLAVAYDDSPIIEVFSGKNLKLLYRPTLSGMKEEGTFSKVAFSADGKYLYAAGGYAEYIDGKGWKYVIREWENTKQGGYTDYPVAETSSFDIKAVKSGGFLVCSGSPDFGRMDKFGKKIFYKIGEINDFSNKQYKHFKINYEADEIVFKPFGKKALQFSVTDRTLTGSKNLPCMNSYTDQKASLKVTNWKSYFPKINGTKLSFLEEYEYSRTTDISPKGNKAVLGTEWNLYCVNASGKKMWKTTDVSGVTWAVKVSGNGKVVAAAQDGGVINWYRMSDGKLLLTLYAHPDNKRWVLYTPSGYYDASPGSESLFGWHLNNDADKEAYFFPASKFRKKYYRPDVIDNVLTTLNEDEAIRIANLASNRRENTTKIVNMLPPVVSITKPTHNQEVTSENVTIEYSAKSPKGETILNVKFLIDGRPYETQRGLKLVGTTNTSSKTIIIPKKDVLLQVLAENQHGWSEPAEVRIKWKGKVQVDFLKPTLYVLAIGVSDYQNNAYDLNYAAKDAKDFAKTMQAQKGGLYKEVVVKILNDAGATKNDILDGLDWIQKECTSRDIAMIFLAGHGINDNVGTFYYLPYEANIDNLRRSCLMFTELKYTSSAIAGKVVMFVDACHSGNAMGGRRAAPDVNALVNELSDVESGAVVFTSSTGKQFSLEDAKWQNGAFTEALIEGMNGGADLFGNGSITVKALDAFLAQRVKELTSGKQSPTVVIPQ